MEAHRFDDIFQVKGGVPIIAGLYIGMDDDDASPLLEDLLSSRFVHSYEYPADLIYELQITVQYFLFPHSDKISRIVLYIPRKIENEDVDIMKEYLSRKYYNERVDEMIQKDSSGKYLAYMIDIYNEFYHFSMYSGEKDRMIVELKAAKDDEDIYNTINTISNDKTLKGFIRDSIKYCGKKASGEDGIDTIIPMTYGLPSFYHFHLGDEGIDGEDFGYLDEINDDSLIGNKVRDDYDMHYEITQGYHGCVESIILSMSFDSEGIYPFIKYLKKSFYYEEAYSSAKYDKYRKMRKETMEMKNQYISIEICRHYKTDDPIIITITALDEEHPEIYRVMDTVYNNEYIMSFFEGVERFYKDGEDTQDAKFNELRRTYDTFEQAANAYTGELAAWARDMGGYSKEEYEHDVQMCLDAWNRVGGEGFPMNWVYVGEK